MEIHLQCPACNGAAVFRSRTRGTQGRLIGRCTACSSAYSLQGGRLSEIDKTRGATFAKGPCLPLFGGRIAPRAEPKASSPPTPDQRPPLPSRAVWSSNAR